MIGCSSGFAWRKEDFGAVSRKGSIHRRPPPHLEKEDHRTENSPAGGAGTGRVLRIDDIQHHDTRPFDEEATTVSPGDGHRGRVNFVIINSERDFSKFI